MAITRPLFLAHEMSSGPALYRTNTTGPVGRGGEDEREGRKREGERGRGERGRDEREREREGEREMDRGDMDSVCTEC